MLTFPSTLPRPVWGGFAMQPDDTRVVSPVEQGLPRIRRRSSLVPTVVQCRWRFTNEDFQIFKHFCEVGLRGCSDSFTFGVRVGVSFFDETCIFQSWPTYTPSSPSTFDVEATLVVQEKLGLPLYRDIAYTDAGATPLELGTLSGSRTTWRAEVYVRTAVNAGTSATLKVGHATDDDAYVTAISVATAGRYVIIDGGGYDGALMGATESTARTVSALLTCTGTAATAGDLSVALFWKP